MSIYLLQYIKLCLFYILSYLCYYIIFICYYIVFFIILFEEYLKRYLFYLLFKLSILKFLCGLSIILNIIRYIIIKLINFCRIIKKLYFFSFKILYLMCFFLSKFYVFFVVFIFNLKMMQIIKQCSFVLYLRVLLSLRKYE